MVDSNSAITKKQKLNAKRKGNMDDECRGVRQRKKHSEPICCPVCSVTIRPHEVEQHFSMEVDRLHKLSVNKGRKSNVMNTNLANSSASSMNTSSASVSTGNTSATAEQIPSDGKECWATYQKIKNNRNARLKHKSRKRKADDPQCPVCNERVTGDLNIHVELCLRKGEKNGRNSNGVAGSEDEDDSIDVEGDTYEEYEWAGQTRIRASSLLEGGFTAAGLGTSITSTSQSIDDDDEDLNVDGDDTQIYGSSQYTERDIILPIVDTHKKDTLYLRNLVIGETSTVNIPPHSKTNETDNINDHLPSVSNEQSNGRINTVSEHRINDTITKENVYSNLQHDNLIETIHSNEDVLNISITSSSSPSTAATSAASLVSRDSALHIIEALKEKIREYEVIIKNKCKCLICMDDFRVPVVSICCWHVHCEECWLRTLGARKLCPQCNMITSPADLRKIYM